MIPLRKFKADLGVFPLGLSVVVNDNSKDLKLCGCGCGDKVRIATNRFIYGHNSRGKNNPAWKGGRKYDDDGYVLVWKPDHPFANSNGYVREHRLVYEEYYKCCLLPWAVIHHINGIKDDNRIENLAVLINQGFHALIHHVGNTYRRGLHIDTSNRVCHNCGSNKTYTRYPSKSNKYKTPFLAWYKLPTDKSKLCCAKCYRAIIKRLNERGSA